MKRIINKSFAKLILKIVLMIYPIYVMIIAFLPSLYGAFVNINLVNARELLLILVWTPIFSLFYIFTKKKFFYYILVFFTFFNGFVNLGHWLMVETPITATGIFVILNTSVNEAVGFSATKFSPKLLFFIPYIYLFYLALRNPPETQVAVNRVMLRNSILVLINTISLSILLFFGVKQDFWNDATPRIVSTVVAYKKELDAYRALEKELDLRLKNVEAKATTTEDNQVVVLIIGESTNRNYMALYGSEFPTNPKLSKLEDLIVYEDVVSAYAHTMMSVPISLTNADLENKQSPPNSITLAEVFRGAGFETYWLSNQSPFGAWDNLITLLGKQYKHELFVNITGNSSHETLVKNSFDEKLFQPLQNALNSEGDKKLIVLHLLGTHLNYDQRYPSSFDKFIKQGEKVWKDKQLGMYRNAVLYNDYVVDSLIRIVADHCDKNGDIGSVVYISDHGESVYDEGDKVGHDYAESMHPSLLEIPFLVWLSPAYFSNFPETAQIISENRNKPFVTDNLFHAMIDLGKVNTKFLEPQKSIFNSDFDATRKRILADELDYDEKKNQ